MFNFLKKKINKQSNFSSRGHVKSEKINFDFKNFSSKNISTKRPGTGRSPMCYWDVVGSRAEKIFEADDLL